ncbi:rifampin ADP-ribosyl transferase [Sporosarcina sp. NCCP-2716]|uniref:NAD(+)--rifampin ADP-ribosyltransferase n=1 Tax=Sporosarcina sp. NCCP-2716 TaxID=2943679 RepID=UPI00203B4CE7|nr:NAD(+)--rifampin ADP-ribosyltransferase [Sporosarcina sp. NCCP-2716]GKV69942.1 rifampin ADP-ribosyl transferase [Sporosarcina sp. NCCP-2716]
MDQPPVSTERGPFFHGTKAELQIGDLLQARQPSNYRETPLRHIYFSATLEAAKWGAELAVNGAAEHIYLVEPTGEFEDDPNVTDKRFPGNPTRSYRSQAPLRVIAELGKWKRHTDEEIRQMQNALQTLREEGKDVIYD